MHPLQKWFDFYRPFFPDEASLQEFVTECGAQLPPQNRAKLIMHQTRRLVMLADEMTSLRPGREALAVLFLVVCAEHTAKLHDDFNDEGLSKKYARRFFEEFASSSDRAALDAAFENQMSVGVGMRAAIDFLYRVRSEVVHDGNYWDLSLKQNGLNMLSMWGDDGLAATITLGELRGIVVRTAIRIAQDALKSRNVSS